LVVRKQAAVRLRTDGSLEVRTSSLRGRFEYEVAPTGTVTRRQAPSLPKIRRFGYLMETVGLPMVGLGFIFGPLLGLLYVFGVIGKETIPGWLLLIPTAGLVLFLVGKWLSDDDPFVLSDRGNRYQFIDVRDALPLDEWFGRVSRQATEMAMGMGMETATGTAISPTGSDAGTLAEGRRRGREQMVDCRRRTRSCDS
jgi:hypothetical protein